MIFFLFSCFVSVSSLKADANLIIDFILFIIGPACLTNGIVWFTTFNVLLALFNKLLQFVFLNIEKILTEAESYNEILDNNLKDWINNKTEFSQEEKKLLEIVIKTGDTTLILPSYYNEIKQQALLDNYEGNSTSTELINLKSELYAQIKDSLLVSMEEDNIKGNNIYTEYLIYSYANTKQTENIEKEVETIMEIF